MKQHITTDQLKALEHSHEAKFKKLKALINCTSENTWLEDMTLRVNISAMLEILKKQGIDTVLNITYSVGKWEVFYSKAGDWILTKQESQRNNRRHGAKSSAKNYATHFGKLLRERRCKTVHTQAIGGGVNLMPVAELIPFSTFKERLRIVAEELRKNKHVEVWEKHIYSATKWREINASGF